MTFRKAIIDVSQAFESGQIYVALSRLTSLEGLVLASPITDNHLKIDQNIADFTKTRPDIQVLEDNFDYDCYTFSLEYIRDAFSFEILTRGAQDFCDSFDKDENRSKKQKDHHWAKELLKRILELQNIATKFRAQIEQCVNQTNFRTFLLKRVEAAEAYFSPLLTSDIDDVETKLNMLRQIEGVKGYYKEVDSFRILLKRQAEKIKRATLILHSIEENKPLIRENPREPSVYVPKAKIPTHLVSYKLYQQGKTLEEIAQIRLLKLKTIQKHFIIWIERNMVTFEDYLSEEETQEIIEAAYLLDTNFLKPIKEYFKDRFNYFQIQIAMTIWKHGI